MSLASINNSEDANDFCSVKTLLRRKEIDGKMTRKLMEKCVLTQESNVGRCPFGTINNSLDEHSARPLSVLLISDVGLDSAFTILQITNWLVLCSFLQRVQFTVDFPETRFDGPTYSAHELCRVT